MTSLFARPKGWQGGRGLQRHPLLSLCHHSLGSLCVLNSKTHPQQVKKRPWEAFPQLVLGAGERDGAPQRHCQTHSNSPVVTALLPWPHALLPTQFWPGGKLLHGW